MESTEKATETTELLIKAFSQIHDKIFVPYQQTELCKANDIATPICLALGTINNFGYLYDRRAAVFIKNIKGKFNANNSFDKEIIDFCDDILDLVISANRFVDTYGKMKSEIENILVDEIQ